jgi:hypothetical protein
MREVEVQGKNNPQKKKGTMVSSEKKWTVMNSI